MKNTLIFRKDFDGRAKYTIGVSKKVGEEYKSRYMQVAFRKGVELTDKTMIQIKEWWPSWYETKDGMTVFTMFINGFEVVDAPPKGFEYATVDESECPF